MDLLSLVDPVMTSPLLYPLLAALGILDGVLPIVPSEAAILAAGVFARASAPTLLLVVVATAIGVFIGDHLAYGLSRSVSGLRLLSRSPRVGRPVAAAGRQFEGRAGLLIVASRFVPGGRVAMNVAAGTVGLPLSRFSPAAAIAALAWAAYIAGLGVLGGAAFVENPLLGIAVGLGLSFVVGGTVELVRCRPGRPAGAARRSMGAATVATTAAAVLFVPVPATAPVPVDGEAAWCTDRALLVQGVLPRHDARSIDGRARRRGLARLVVRCAGKARRHGRMVCSALRRLSMSC